MEYIFEALSLVFNIETMIIIIIGIILGIAIGALPGLSSTMGVALFIPVTYNMHPATGLVFLSSIYMSSTYGGSISAILIKTPGTPSAIITAIDGYELTKQGKGGEALSMATIASTIGGLISCIALMFLSPPLAKIVVAFGSPEMFLLSILGLSIIVGLSKGSILKGLISGILGMLLSLVGIDTITGEYRFTYNILSLFAGLSTVAIVIGIFSASQVYNLASQKRTTIQYNYDKNQKLNLLKASEFFKNLFNIIRSGIIGTIIGILPGAGVSIASALAYNVAKSSSKEKELFGEGSLEGVSASESANNGVVGGSLVPLLTLGIPGNAVSAVFLGGLVIHGLRPGPELFTKYGGITYALFIGLIVSTIIMLFIGLFTAKYFAKVSVVPTNILAPIIMVLCVIGSYSVSNSESNIYIMFTFGILGYLMAYFKYSQPSFILGLVLGPIAEQEFRRSLLISGGNYSIFISTPISVLLIVLIIFFFFYPFFKELFVRKSKV